MRCEKNVSCRFNHCSPIRLPAYEGIGIRRLRAQSYRPSRLLTLTDRFTLSGIGELLVTVEARSQRNLREQLRLFHLFRYLDEQAFRFNNRATKENEASDGDRFDLALSQIAGKRLTFAEVTGKVGRRPSQSLSVEAREEVRFRGRFAAS